MFTFANSTTFFHIFSFLIALLSLLKSQAADLFPNTLQSFTSHSQSPPTMTSWFQRTITLPARSRGSYLIEDHINSEIPEIRSYKTGLLNLFIQHTSCALSLNENWDDDVRADMSDALDRIVPEDRKGNLYRHSAEGLDDMPVRIVPSLTSLFRSYFHSKLQRSVVLSVTHSIVRLLYRHMSNQL